jgi:hypothetical protein
VLKKYLKSRIQNEDDIKVLEKQLNPKQNIYKECSQWEEVFRNFLHKDELIARDQKLLQYDPLVTSCIPLIVILTDLTTSVRSLSKLTWWPTSLDRVMQATAENSAQQRQTLPIPIHAWTATLPRRFGVQLEPDPESWGSCVGVLGR